VSGLELDQWVSRESARIDPAKTIVRVGRDGLVYVLTHKELQRGYVIRMSPDGSNRSGHLTGYSCMIATANAQGNLGTCNASWRGSSVEFLNHELRVLARGKITNSQIEVGGASGDFYLRSEDSLVRVGTDARVLQRYKIDPAILGNQPAAFRVNEQQGAFYILAADEAIHCIRFDGQEAWKLPAHLRLESAVGRSGRHVAFDVSDDGLLYVLEPQKGDIRVYAANATATAPPALKATLNLPDDQIGKWIKPRDFGAVSDVCVAGENLLIRRREGQGAGPDEFYQLYDRKTARLVQTVRADFVHLQVSYPSEVWTAGTSVPLRIKLETPGERLEPHWRVWASPFGSGDWRELAFDGKNVSVPAEGTGLYRIRVSDELDPSRPKFSGYGALAKEDLGVDGVVEIRAAGATGTLSLWTPAGRTAYGRGEDIPVTVRLRAPGRRERQAVVRLVTEDRRTTVAEWPVTVAIEQDATVLIPAALTRLLSLGKYRLTATAERLTIAEQTLSIGPGIAEPSFQVIEYGDYSRVSPSRLDLWDLADGTRDASGRLRKLGVSLGIERDGIVLPPYLADWNYRQKNQVPPWQATIDRLASDPSAAAPEKLEIAPSIQQSIAWWSAQGIQKMSVLLNNDAGMPLGTGFDKRTPEELRDAIHRVHDALLLYPAFRGWSWGANWFTFKGRGALAGRTKAEQEAYRAALEDGAATGRWNLVLDTVCDLRLSWATDGIKCFEKTLDDVKRPDLRTAMSGPFRSVETYPPVTFADVDEVDLYVQWEQVPMPYFAPYAVDFYKRPGKRVLCHPDIGNENGTGDLILPNAFAAIMRGSGSMGFKYGWGYKPVDARTSQGGCLSLNRAFLPLMQSLGAWLATQENRDPVAIVASSRMFRTDKWKGDTGQHFARMFEAWLACFHAHYPARIVFSEDLTPETLKQHKVVLMVGQWMEPEPILAEALKTAAAAGVKVFYDETCRAELMKGFAPLEFAFDQHEKLSWRAGSDSTFWRMPQTLLSTAALLQAKLAPVCAPVAQTDNPEVLFTERVAEQGRYLFVVNNTTPELAPGNLWRMTLILNTRTPVQAAVRWDVPASSTVYEFFSQKLAQRRDGAFMADLQVQPFRLFAALPAAIQRLALSGPVGCTAGQHIAWNLQVQDGAGHAIAAAVPVTVRLIAADGTVLAQVNASSGSQGASGELLVPLGVAAGDLFLEAQERLSGQTARVVIRTEASPLPVREPKRSVAAVAPDRPSTEARTFQAAPEERFGPHLRDVAVSNDGKTAILNAFNWDQNVYGVDVETGVLRFQRRLGNYFTFSPQAVADGFAVQGFDFNTGEGYHLYRLNTDGVPARRFALTGFPLRLPGRFLATIVNDRINNFAASPDGSWIAAAGDLGLAVWDRRGQLLWSREWWPTERKEVRLLAVSASSLLVFDQGELQDTNPFTGQLKGEPLDLEEAGKILAVSQSGETLFVGGDADDGCILAVRGGKILRRIPMKWSEMAPLPDGSGLVVTHLRELSFISLETGRQWIFRGDEHLRSPRVSADGSRVAVSSDLGTLYVVSLAGTKLLERDLGVLCVPAWLPDGDLLLGTWMGEVSRIDGEYRPKWRTLLRPAATDLRGKMLAAETTPTTRVDWGNAEPTPLLLTANVLTAIGMKDLRIYIKQGSNAVPIGRKDGPKTSHEILFDGQATPPTEPLLDWRFIPEFMKGDRQDEGAVTLEIEIKRKQIKVEAVTLAENPQHPESWLRDFTFEVWNDEQQKWISQTNCLSNQVLHTHRLPAPVIGNRFRLSFSKRHCGNVWLGEIAFHGEDLGVVKTPKAVKPKADPKDTGKPAAKRAKKAIDSRENSDPAPKPSAKP